MSPNSLEYNIPVSKMFLKNILIFLLVINKSIDLLRSNNDILRAWQNFRIHKRMDAHFLQNARRGA